MIKNNKGVTLVELLIVIVVMGIIAAFSIPAVGTIIENTQKDAILNDALQIENAANMFCASASPACATDEDLTFTEVSLYIEGFDTSIYEISLTPGDTVASKTGSGWEVSLERLGANSGEWEFDAADAGLVPSASTRSNITADLGD